jgi:autotransporter family porin
MALGGGLLLAPTASAQTLSGAQTTTITLTATPLVVDTDNSFGIVTTSGEALVLIGTNGTSFTDNGNASTITGATDGIDARNDGTGALSVTSTGTVTGTNYSGIIARNSGSGTDLTISAAAVSGGTDGIFALN